MAIPRVTESHKCKRVSREWSLLVVTIALTSFSCLVHVCASSTEGQSEDHVPTLKEIFGSIPKNSFPVVRRSGRMLGSNTDSSFKQAGPLSESLRRGLRSEPHDLTIPVSSVGFNPDNSLLSAFYAQLQIGTPPQDLLLLIDTGSPLLWVQIKECVVCETQLLPNYDPKLSSTFETDIVNGSRAPWEISYGDGSVNQGYIAKDTVTIDDGNGNRVVIPGFEFGAANNNSGINYETSGLLGLSPGYPGVQIPPFLTQLETLSNGTYSKFSKTFRYCFPDRVKQINTTSFLSFGNIDKSDTDSPYSASGFQQRSKILWTPLVLNGFPYVNTDFPYYAVNLTAITVGGIIIPIDPQELTFESIQVNETITILDSGTTVNQLREPYFSQFTDTYANLTKSLSPTYSNINGYYSYNISRDAFDAALFPTVSFIFEKWGPHGAKGEIEVLQTKDNLLIPVVGPDSDVVYALNVQNSSDTTNIIGNYAQENFLIEFDLEKSRVGFLRASCTFDY